MAKRRRQTKRPEVSPFIARYTGICKRCGRNELLASNGNCWFADRICATSETLPDASGRAEPPGATNTKRPLTETPAYRGGMA